MLDFQSSKAKLAVCHSVSTGPKSFCGHPLDWAILHLKVSKVRQDCRLRLGFEDLGPGSRRVSNGLTNIRRATKVFGTKLRGHVGVVGCFCS